MKWVKVDQPKVGDRALHKSNQLDSREVSRVKGSLIWLQLLTTEAGPLPVDNYTYSRKEGS